MILNGVRILKVMATITVRYLFQSFKIQLPDGAIIYFLNFLTNFIYLIVLLFLFVTFRLFWYRWNFLFKWKNWKPLWKHVFSKAVFVFLLIVFIKWKQNYRQISTVPIMSIIKILECLYRSSLREVLCNKGVLRNSQNS